MRPELPVAIRDLAGGFDGVPVFGERVSSGKVHEFPGHILLGDRHVVAALAVAELRVNLSAFSDDQVGCQCARVAAEQNIGQRAVTPEETSPMEVNEKTGQGTQELVPQINHLRLGEE